MTEEWLPIDGYEGLYEVSSLGRVRSLVRAVLVTRLGRQIARKVRGVVLAPVLDSDGYETVRLCGDRFKVQRLVCAAFHGVPPGTEDAAHLDGTRRNNRADNLAWTSRRENMAHKRLHGTEQAGARHGCAKLTAADVATLKGAWLAGAKERDLAPAYGVTADHVARIVRGKRWAEDGPIARRQGA